MLKKIFEHYKIIFKKLQNFEEIHWKFWEKYWKIINIVITLSVISERFW